MTVVNDPVIRIETPIAPARSVRQKLAVTVLCGGPSSEREVSLKSGAAVAAGLRAAGHDVIEADISPTDLSALSRADVDVAFIALHGAFGEDGTVQRILEDRGIAYTGSGPPASRIAMHKQAAKEMFEAAGLPVPRGRVVGQMHARTVTDLIEQLGLPLVTKPVGGGSSILVNICRTREEINRGVCDILSAGEVALVEEFIDGRELTIGILDNSALPVIELRTSRDFYDYVAKYKGNYTEYVFDTGLDAATYRHVQQLAELAHAALGCRDFSRVDIRLDRVGRPFILELNSIPGFTEKSLLPKAARKAGVEFPALVDGIARRTMSRR